MPGRGCFGDLPGDGIVVSPPSPIVEQLFLGGTPLDSIHENLSSFEYLSIKPNLKG